MVGCDPGGCVRNTLFTYTKCLSATPVFLIRRCTAACTRSRNLLGVTYVPEVDTRNWNLNESVKRVAELEGSQALALYTEC